MRQPKNVVRDWLRSVTPERAREVAKAAQTSVEHLRHVAAGRRNMRADFAQRFSHASGLDARELCKTCARCPLAN